MVDRYRIMALIREGFRNTPHPGVAYLEYKRGTDDDGFSTGDINEALNRFWRDRAAHAPGQEDLRRYLAAEADSLKHPGAK